MAKASRPVPEPTPETKHFWDGTKAGELRLQRCDRCSKVYFPPRPFCPACSHRSVSVFRASGRARLASYVINHRSHPAWDGPYAIALVELEEGVRMMGTVTGCPVESVRIGMPVEAYAVECGDGMAVPFWRPAARA